MNRSAVVGFANPTPNPLNTMYTLVDTFNGYTISSHRTLANAVSASLRFSRSIRRANGASSYIPTEILRNGERLSESEIDESHEIQLNIQSR
jgi:hypothetical protein